jgi:N-acetylneuraminate synthase
MTEYAVRYRCPVGLSDHSGSAVPSIIATWLGARVLEVHITMSHDMFGPDVSSSLAPEVLKQMIENVRFVARMRENPVDKDALAAESADLRRLFGKSACAKVALRVGDIVNAATVAFRKPGLGIGEVEFARFLNRKLWRDVAAGAMFREEDFGSE